MSKRLNLIELSKKEIKKVKAGELRFVGTICDCPNGVHEKFYGVKESEAIKKV